MKKLVGIPLLLVLSMVLMLALAACGEAAEPPTEAPGTHCDNRAHPGDSRTYVNPGGTKDHIGRRGVGGLCRPGGRAGPAPSTSAT